MGLQPTGQPQPAGMVLPPRPRAGETDQDHLLRHPAVQHQVPAVRDLADAEKRGANHRGVEEGHHRP